MHVKSVVSALALSATMLLSGSAFAQTMFNGAELSADDLAAVTERCNQLAMAATDEKTTGDATTGAQASDSETPDNTGDNETTPTDAPVANELEAATTSIDLDTVTWEQCEAAGIGGAM